MDNKCAKCVLLCCWHENKHGGKVGIGLELGRAMGDSGGMENKNTVSQLAVKAALVPNWTGLNAVELLQAGRLTDETLKKWARDSANADARHFFDANDLTGSRARYDEYMSAFIAHVHASQ